MNRPSCRTFLQRHSARCVILVGVFLAATSALPGARAETRSVVQARSAGFDLAVATLDEADLGRRARAQRIQQAYERAFPADFTHAALGSASDGDLHVLFAAASTASFENPEGPVYRDALAALERLGSHASDQEIRTAQGMLFQGRRWDELNAFGRRYAGRANAQSPRLVVQGQPGRNAILDADGTHLVIHSVDISRGPRVVVVSHPLCPFTRQAMREIDASPQLKGLMRKYSRWIAPPDRNMDFTPFADWNGSHPEAPISIAYGYSAWPELDEWGTPTFYFFKDGTLVDTVVGWPRGGRMGALKAGLAKIGLAIE